MCHLMFFYSLIVLKLCILSKNTKPPTHLIAAFRKTKIKTITKFPFSIFTEFHIKQVDIFHLKNKKPGISQVLNFIYLELNSLSSSWSTSCVRTYTSSIFFSVAFYMNRSPAACAWRIMIGRC